ncbi:alpha/beta fold hydrolase [Chryseomicrobium palamuruense]|uniref:Alpha/beta fold hydrolase n=1 Tax=Chryseomicrobium palamuruense TaxID=682973 RepID=A0ABV8UUS2_9BACL
MWETQLVETERGTFEYFTYGEGEPMAVTHHYSEYNANGNTFARALAEQYKVYLINLRGAGNSAKAENEEEYSMEETVKDLDAIREALGYDKWGFAGHSTGGMLALVYALAFPDSLTKIIVGGAAASKAYGEHPDCIYSTSNENYDRIVYIMDQLSRPETLREERQKLGYEWALMSYHSEENLKRSMTKPNSGKTCGPRLDYFRQVEYPKFDLTSELSSIQVPAYVYTGKYDNQCPLVFGEEIAEGIPNSEFWLFEESNHFPYSEEEGRFSEFVEATVR